MFGKCRFLLAAGMWHDLTQVPADLVAVIMLSLQAIAMTSLN